jgi:hypothetical protein
MKLLQGRFGLSIGKVGGGRCPVKRHPACGVSEYEVAWQAVLPIFDHAGAFGGQGCDVRHQSIDLRSGDLAARAGLHENVPGGIPPCIGYAQERLECRWAVPCGQFPRVVGQRCRIARAHGMRGHDPHARQRQHAEILGREADVQRVIVVQDNIGIRIGEQGHRLIGDRRAVPGAGRESRPRFRAVSADNGDVFQTVRLLLGEDKGCSRVMPLEVRPRSGESPKLVGLVGEPAGGRRLNVARRALPDFGPG